MNADAADNDDGRTNTVLHLPTGRFAPGNPGRPRGSKNRISTEAIAAIKEMKNEAIEQLRSKLQRGEWDAITFILERILPKGRTVELDDTSPSNIATALANGELTPEESRHIATAISKLREIEDIDQIRQRLDELEQLLNGDARK